MINDSAVHFSHPATEGLWPCGEIFHQKSEQYGEEGHFLICGWNVVHPPHFAGSSRLSMDIDDSPLESYLY